MTDPSSGPQDWPETLATVLSCTYEARTGRALAFGLPSSRHFHITYNYWANDALHTADLFTDKPIPQGSLFPIRYNPAQPQRSLHAESSTKPAKVPLLASGIAGSLVLFFIWLLYLHGCQ
ncbi:MAG TPA: hypothetical protein VKV02_00905 [Acidobacteriaceae bacterium]|nr:hypothetical protein [Acidobacteriaceae bacterium]